MVSYATTTRLWTKALAIDPECTDIVVIVIIIGLIFSGLVTKPVTVAEICSSRAYCNSAGREGETDSFGRYHCHKSASSRVKTPSRKISSDLPSSESANLMSSPSPSPSPRKSGVCFLTSILIMCPLMICKPKNETWIQKQRKQSQNRSGRVKPAYQKQKACREVICVDDHSDANSVANSEEVRDHDGQKDHAEVKVKVSVASIRSPPVISRNAMLHPTAYRGVFFEEAPPNMLVQTGVACSEPFESDCNMPLTFYDMVMVMIAPGMLIICAVPFSCADETDTLDSYCSILETFGKPNQCISSVFPTEMSKPQSDVTRSVRSLVTAHLPIIRRCHQRKVQATLSEARSKFSAYQAALKKHKSHRYQYVTMPHLLSRSTTEKQAVKQLKTMQHTCSIDDQSVSFQIGRGDGFVREKTVSSLIQINRVKNIQSLRKYTTSIGLRANYRVDDDPILRTQPPLRQMERTIRMEVSAKKYGLRIDNLVDDEVAEYVLRLVVGCLGDTDQVFHALRREFGFSQAYTTYSELKKLHDSRQRASVRLNRMENLCRNEDRAVEPDVAAITNLMEQSLLSTDSKSCEGLERLQPPIRNFESNIVDNLVENTTVSMATLGLRATESYSELVDVYGGSLCRMCYMYACHEHGGDHPLPARRLDPMYPRVQLKTRVNRSDAYAGNAVHYTAGSDGDVVYLGKEMVLQLASLMECTKVQAKQLIHLESDVKMSDGSSAPRQPPRYSIADSSEYIDASHVPMVAARIHSCLSPGCVCGKQCWKNVGSIGKRDHRSTLSTAEFGVIRKLRETMGNNSCLLAAMIGSASCIELHALIVKDLSNNETRDGGGRSRRVRNWKHGRRSGGSNHELLQRTRNQ
ncbi:LOW QUALITY PROTEIN: Cleavage induced protein [Phytophthora megakarya]|uniref:Cleavage induced protein n=1 Tax=Phytophthora megakarya TaxID=4795 RepID=A0A225WUB9_9STRA|nr:LOW QUALITY PROTEIN: Cleavage induced protein [Phytophthora megakarya]